MTRLPATHPAVRNATRIPIMRFRPDADGLERWLGPLEAAIMEVVYEVAGPCTVNALGQFKLTDANGAIVGGSVFGGADGWAGLLTELARKETQTLFCTTCGKRITNGHFDGQCGPCYRSPTRIDTGALGTLGTRLTETTDPRELATLYRAIGMLLATGGVLPALPVRPRLPRSADVSKQMLYLDALEKYANALEDRLGVRP